MSMQCSSLAHAYRHVDITVHVAISLKWPTIKNFADVLFAVTVTVPLCHVHYDVHCWLTQCCSCLLRLLLLARVVLFAMGCLQRYACNAMLCLQCYAMLAITVILSADQLHMHL